MKILKIFLILWVISIVASILIMAIMTLILKYQVKKEKSMEFKLKHLKFFGDTMVLLILFTPIANLYSAIRLASRFDKVKAKWIEDIDMR